MQAFTRAGTNTEWFEVEANNTSTNANRIGVPSEPNTWCRILNVYQNYFIPGVVLCRFRIMSGRSVVWNFCRESESDKKKWKCEVCCETARNANTTTNLLNHLKRRHPAAMEDAEPRPKVKVKVQGYCSKHDKASHRSQHISNQRQCAIIALQK